MKCANYENCKNYVNPETATRYRESASGANKYRYICPDCAKITNKRITRPQGADTKNTACKDLINTFSFVVDNPTNPAGWKRKMEAKGGALALVGKTYSAALPASHLLNKASGLCADGIATYTRDYGGEVNSASVRFSSEAGKYDHTFHWRASSGEALYSWLLRVEDEACEACGFGKFSALKTGSRKNG